MLIVDTGVPYKGNIAKVVTPGKDIVPVKLVLNQRCRAYTVVDTVCSKLLTAFSIITPYHHAMGVLLNIPGKLIVHIGAKPVAVVEHIALDFPKGDKLTAHLFVHKAEPFRLGAAQGPHAVLVSHHVVANDDMYENHRLEYNVKSVIKIRCQ